MFILVPALVGLKGNLEMTLASRLSTAVSGNTCIHTQRERDGDNNFQRKTVKLIFTLHLFGSVARLVQACTYGAGITFFVCSFKCVTDLKNMNTILSSVISNSVISHQVQKTICFAEQVP